jgi:transcriptional regulator with XRE-family HTH domain
MTGGWEHVAERVRQRRLELGLRQAETPGVSPASWRKLEGAKQQSYKPFLLRNVERALGWAPGTIERLLAGMEAEPARSADLGTRLAALEARFDRLERAIESLVTASAARSGSGRR